jgi:hypothetical protein
VRSPEKKGRVKDNKFQKFYPIELELYIKYRPAVLGGEGSAYFLKEAKDIQEATVKKVSSRYTLRAKNSAELHEQAVDKQGKVDLSATMQDSPAAALGASFTLQYEEHLKIEHERLHEEHKCADTDHERALTDRERAYKPHSTPCQTRWHIAGKNFATQAAKC